MCKIFYVTDLRKGLIFYITTENRTIGITISYVTIQHFLYYVHCRLTSEVILL
jgi:hypothetical protein